MKMQNMSQEHINEECTIWERISELAILATDDIQNSEIGDKIVSIWEMASINNIRTLLNKLETLNDKRFDSIKEFERSAKPWEI